LPKRELDTEASASGFPPGHSADPGTPRFRPEAGAPPLLVHVVTVPCTLFFLAGQPRYLRERRGLAVHAVASPSPDLSRFGEVEEVTVHPVRMARRVTPFADARSLLAMWRLFRELRPVVVHAHTPKGGLLGMMAAFLARVPVRLYHMHGLPLLTAKGLRKQLLRFSERASCALAQEVLCVSQSIRQIAVEEGLCPPRKIKVLLDGSVNGVDAERFRPAAEVDRTAARARLGIPPAGRVVGYVGRIARDKGMAELAAAWEALRRGDPQLHLLVVGEVDDSDPPPAWALAQLREDGRVHFTGQAEDVVRLYAAMDVVALPTYREGFTTVALETAAMGLPIVATAVPGCVDAVLDQSTGTLVPPRDPSALALALTRYLARPALREAHGAAARERVLARFRREALWEAIAGEYDLLLGSRRGLSGHALRSRPSDRPAKTRDA